MHPRHARDRYYWNQRITLPLRLDKVSMRVNALLLARRAGKISLLNFELVNDKRL